MTTAAVETLTTVQDRFRIWLQPADAENASRRQSEWTRAGLAVRVMRGDRMRDYDGLFDEFAAAMQFPWYFGYNGNAFDECIADLSWIDPGAGYVLVINSPLEVLVDADGGALTWLYGSLDRAYDEWATPVERGAWRDRPAVPFHVVLVCEPDRASEVMRLWSEAGAEVSPLSLRSTNRMSARQPNRHRVSPVASWKRRSLPDPVSPVPAGAARQ